jgi:hypothetical protein
LRRTHPAGGGGERSLIQLPAKEDNLKRNQLTKCDRSDPNFENYYLQQISEAGKISN